jgi:hypothetical protein
MATFESLLTFALGLIFVPALGATALCIVGAVFQVATAPTTPGWQKYLWFLGTGWALLNLRQFAEALASGSGGI